LKLNLQSVLCVLHENVAQQSEESAMKLVGEARDRARRLLVERSAVTVPSR
jgi:hypothetical protein